MLRFALCGLNVAAEPFDDRVEERLHAFLKRRGNREYPGAAFFLEGLGDFRSLLFVEQVGLGQRNDFGLLVEPRAVAVEL